MTNDEKEKDFGQPTWVHELLKQRSPIVADVMFSKDDKMVATVRLVHCLTPERVTERTEAVSKFLKKEGMKEGKLQVIDFGKGTLLVETHDGVVYITSFYGKVAKEDMKVSHQAIKKVREQLGEALEQGKELPEDYPDIVCKAFEVDATPPQLKPPKKASATVVRPDAASKTPPTIDTGPWRNPVGATAIDIHNLLHYLPHGIPTEFQNRTVEALVDHIITTSYAMTVGGIPVMELDGYWYFADHYRYNNFLQWYRGPTEELTMMPFAAGVKGEIHKMIIETRPTGYSVKPLIKALEAKEELAKQVLEKYRVALPKAQALMERLEELNPEGFEERWGGLAEKVLSVVAQKKVEEEIELLKNDILTRDRMNRTKLTLLRKEIEDLKAEGFNVPHLYRLLQTGNVERITEGLREFELEKETLKRLEKRVDHLKNQGFEMEIEKIRRHLGDPTQIPIIEEELARLERQLEKEEERESYLMKLEERFQSWERQGFDTEGLQEALSKDFETLVATVESFDAKVKVMIQYDVELKSLLGKGFDKEVQRLRLLINNVENADAISAGIAEINRKVGQFEDIAKGFIERLEKLETHDQLTFLSRVRELKANARDPSKASEVERALIDLEDDMALARGEFVAKLPKEISHEELTEEIKTLPKRLPSTLWGRPPERLATEVLQGPFGNTPDRKVVVKVSRKWYQFEPDEPENLLQPFTGDVTPIDMEKERARRVLKSVSAAVPEVDVSDMRPLAYPFGLSDIEIRDIITQLPRGLPSSLFRTDMDELATEIINAKYVETKKGDILVSLDGKWYFGDPAKRSKYLQVYR